MRANTNLIIIILATAIKGEYLTQIEKDYLEKTSYAPVSTSINVYHNLNPVGVNFAYLEELNKFWPNVNLKNPMYVPILAATAIFKATLTGLNTFPESPEWLDDQVGGQFYGYVTGIANLTCQAEAEPPPTFRWLDAENNPVSSGKIVNEDYKVNTTVFDLCGIKLWGFNIHP